MSETASELECYRRAARITWYVAGAISLTFLMLQFTGDSELFDVVLLGALLALSVAGARVSLGISGSGAIIGALTLGVALALKTNAASPVVLCAVLGAVIGNAIDRRCRKVGP